MKSVRSIFIGLTCLGMATASFAQEEETTQRDPVLDWFLTHCHLHKYPAKSTLIHAGEPLSGWLAIDTELFLWKRITDI